jgi:putative hemolysin
MEIEMSTLANSIMFFIIALSIRALFSFLETSITALRLFKLKKLAAETKKYPQLFHALETNQQRILITILVANSLTDVTTAALATHITETLFSYLNFSGGLGFSLGIFFASMAIVIFGEIIPKNLAKSRGEGLFISVMWLINLAYLALYPLVTVLLRFSNFIMLLIGGKKEDNESDWDTSESEIRFLINYIRQIGLMEREKSQMLENIFELGLTPVKEIMVPVTDIISVDIKTDLQDILKVFAQHNFTRLPVYKESKENIVGILHLKDLFILLSQNINKPLEDLLRIILFVPESMKVNQLLKEFREQHVHMAMVVNEHGSLIGLITLEDILEEIVGEINDEHELSAEKIHPLQENNWLIEGSIDLKEVESLLNITFQTESARTLGGFIAEQLQHLPKDGERILYKNYCFQIQKANPKRVLQVLIFPENPS